MKRLIHVVTVSAVALSFAGGASSSPTRSTCEVTTPGPSFNGASFGSYNVGTPRLAAALPPLGVYVAVPVGRSGWAFVEADGSISTKVGWTRARGQLRITGHRLDRRVARLRAYVPRGYGSSGFQATGLVFPTTGCWSVTGRAGGATLSFVVLVVKG